MKLQDPAWRARNMEKPTSTKLNIQTLFSASVVYGLGSVLEKSIVFLLLPVYTSYLSTREYGIIALLMMVLNLLQVFALSPAQSGLIRYYYSPECRGREKVLFYNTSLCVLLKSIVLGYALFLSRHWIARSILNDPGLEGLITLYAAALAFRPLGNYCLNFLWLKQQAKLFVISSISRFIISVFFILLLMIQFNMGIYAIGIGEILLGILPLIILAYHLIKNIEPVLSFSLIKKVMTYGYPLIISGISNNLIQWGDRYLLNLFTSVSTVGIYTFAYNFSAILNFALVVPLKQAVQPLVFKLERTPDEQRRFTSRCCTYFFLAAMGVWLPFSLFCEWGIQLMARNDMFYGGWYAVPVLSFCYLLHGLGKFFAWGIAMSKKSWHLSGTVLVAAVANILLNLLLIPIFGLLGAALATLACYLIWNAIKLYYSWKFYALGFEVGRLVHIAVVAVALYALSFLSVFPESPLAAFGVKLGLCFAYPFVLLGTGFFHKSENEYFINSVRRMALKWN